MKKKMLAWLLALAMVFTSMPMTANATELDSNSIVSEESDVEEQSEVSEDTSEDAEDEIDALSEGGDEGTGDETEADANAENSWYDAAAEEYVINSKDDLIAFRDAVNGKVDENGFAGKTVKLAADIDLAGVEWIPIGNTSNYFKGTFDGQEHTISNMTINVNTPENDQFAGLFGGVKNAVIKNLTMKNTNISVVGKKVRAAAVVGIADSDKDTPTVLALNFENITVDGCVIKAEAKSGSALIGGVVGYSYPANMKDISVSGLTIDAKADGNNEVRAAAINGYVCGQNISNNGNTRMAFTVENFDVDNVEITANAYTVFAGGYAPYTYYGYITLKNGTIDGLKMDVDAHEAFVGGLVGYFWRSDNGHTVNNVNITGIDFDVTTDYLGETRIGGMVGTSQSPNTKYTDCSVSGTIVERCSDSENPVNYHAKVGGFVARTYEYAQQTYTNCVADVDVTGSNIAGGFVGNHNSTVSYVNCEAKGDVTADIAGGFAGRLTEHGYTTDVTFDGCKVSGNVTGTNVAGGFIGSTANHGWAAWAADNGTAYAKNVTLKDCEIKGTVTSESDYCAGVVGEAKVADGKTITLDNVSYVVEPVVYPSDAPVKISVAQVGDTKYESLKDAVAAANTIEGGATVTLLKDVTLGEKLTISGNVTISGLHKITRADAYTGTFFDVSAGATLTLDGGLVVDGGNNYTFNKDLYDTDLEAMASIAKEDAEKWFTPEEGAPVATAYMITLTKGTSAEAFGGTVNLNDVTIQNNYSTNNGIISTAPYTETNLNGTKITHVAGTQKSGVVVYASGAGIKVNMKGNTVIDGVHVGGNHGVFQIYSGAVFTMDGGEVKNTTGWNSNGNVVGLYSGTFVMNGGTICSNSSVYGPSNGRNAAIYLHSNSVMEMNGGTICHNTGRSRGGIDSSKTTSKLNITGGEILDNISLAGNSTADIGGTVGTWEITGGTFTQDVTQWLVADTGLVYNAEKGQYTTTEDIVEVNGTKYESIAEAIKAANEGDTVKVLASHKVDEAIVIEKNVTIDLNDTQIIGKEVYPVFRIQGGANVTVKNGNITNADYVFVLGASDSSSAGNLTIENGKYHGETTVASVTKGTLTIKGGEFSVDPYEGSYDFLLNCVDANYKDGSAKIVVKGGTFHNFNPADNAAENPKANFVAEGYTVTANEDVYTVAVDSEKAVAQINGVYYPTLAEAVAAANAIEESVTVELIKNATVGEVINVTGNVVIKAKATSLLDLVTADDGDTITYAEGYNGTLFNVTGSLKLEGIIIDGENEFTFYNDTTTVENGQNWYTRFVNVGDEDKAVNANVFVNAGNLTLGEGTKIQNITIASDGANGKTENTETGYVLKYNDDLALIKSNGGTVNMNGAEITGNAGLVLNAINAATAIEGTTIDKNMGAGNKGGIIIANNGTMTLGEDTQIVDNKAMARSATVLGVINGAEVTSEATIERNKHLGVGSNTAGAIVVLEGASQFVMNGGSISNNAGGRAGAIASRWVGGSYGQHEEVSIVLNSGTITGNTASNDSWNGASVFLRSPATIGEGMKIDGTIVVNAAPGELDITGGTFNGELIVTDGLSAEITGGTFNYDPTPWVTGAYDVSNENGTYTVETVTDEWIIDSKAELLRFVKVANAGNNFSGETVKLAADIDLEGETWTPIKNFLGTFDGQRYTISNYHLDATKGHAGFFYKLDYGNGTAVKNLTLSDITATVGNYYVGAFAYFSFAVQDNITIKNFDVTTTASEANIGGYAGWVEWGHIRNCTIENMTVNAEKGAGLVGGLAAILKADNWLQYNNIDVNGFNVTINDTDGKYAEVGGLVGQTQTGHDAPVFTNCDIKGIDVTATGLVTVGGFIARPGAHTTATNCTTQGTIDVTGITSEKESAGGFLGNLGWNNNESSRGGHKLTDCTADVDIITKVAPAGGFVGSATNEQNRNMAVVFTNCTANGDITVVKNGTAPVGGFAGDADRGTYTNCTVAGTVSGQTYAGGLIGQVEKTSFAINIKECDTTNATVTGGKENTAGIIGYKAEDTNVTLTGNKWSEGLYEYNPMEIAQVGDVKYTDLKEAIEACTNGETVVLLTDITYEETDIVNAHGGATGFGNYDDSNPSIIYIGGTKGATADENQPSNVNAVIDLNGHTITNNADAYLFMIMDNAKVTFTDSSEEQTGSIVGNTNMPVIWATGTETVVTIESGKYTTVNAEGLMWATHSGDLVINGGEFKTTAEDASLLIIRNSHDRQNSQYFISGKSTVKVNGGTFHEFNPEKMMDDSETPFIVFDAVTEECKAINNNGVWTVENYVEWIKAELLAGRDVTIEKDIVVDGSMIESIPAPTNGNGKYPNYAIFTVIGDEVTFDINGHNITYNGHKDFEWNGKTYNSCTVAHGLFYANAGADLTIEDSKGTAEVLVYGLASGAYCASPDTKLTITGGTWINKGCATCGGTNIFIYPLQGGEIYITGGYYEQALDSEGESYLLVEHGGEYKNSVIDYSKTKLEISGGTFVGMNPEKIKKFNQTSDDKLDMSSDPIDATADNFAVADNGDGTYTVKPEVVVTFDNLVVANGNELPEFTYKTNFSEISEDGETLVVEEPKVTVNGVGEYEITAKAYVYNSDKYVVTVVPGTLTVTEAVAAIEDTIYSSLADAIAAVKDGETITLLKDNDEDVTIEQTENKNIIIDGNNKTYTGTISIAGKSRATGNETLTIQNFNFETSEKGHIFVAANLTETATRYAHNVTIKNCTFKATDAAVKSAYGIYTERAYNISIENCKADGLSALLRNDKGTEGITVDGCEVINGNYGVNVAAAKDVTVKNSKFAVAGSGVYLRSYDTDVTIDLENIVSTNNVRPVALYNNGVNAEYTFNTKNMTQEDWLGVQYKERSDIKVVVDNSELPSGMVAQNSNAYYNNLQYAINDAEDNDTISLVIDIDLAKTAIRTLDDQYNTYFRVADKTLTIDLNGKTIAGTYEEDSMLVGVFSTEDNGHLILVDETGKAKVNVKAETTVYGLIVNYDATSTITVENGNYILDKASDSLLYTGGNEGITVNGGYYELGNVGTGSNGSPWIFNAKGQNTAHVFVNGGTYNDNIGNQYYPFEVEISKTHVVRNNNDGTWTVVPGEAVASVNMQYESGNWYTKDTGYTTVEEALKAAEANVENATAAGKVSTVTLLKDCADTNYATVVPANVTLDLNGKYFTPKNLLAFGDVIDTAKEVGGIIISDNTAKAFFSLQPSNGLAMGEKEQNLFIPLYDSANGCYRMFEGGFKTLGYVKAESNNEQVKFAFTYTFTNTEAYSLIANNNDTGLGINIGVEWTGREGNPMNYNVTYKSIQEYANQVLSNPNKNYMITFTIKGLNILSSGDTITVKSPSVVTNSGAKAVAGEKTYIIP